MPAKFQAFDDFAIEVEDLLRLYGVEEDDHDYVNKVIVEEWTEKFGSSGDNLLVQKVYVIITQANVTLNLAVALRGEDASIIENEAATILFGNYAYHLVVPDREKFVRSHPDHATKH